MPTSQLVPNRPSSFRKRYREEKVTFEDLLARTNNPRMHAIYEALQRQAKTPDPICLLGETGVGKNLIALALHNAKKTKVRSGPFQEVICTGIPDALFESTVFGHLKGAFTGADHVRAGLAKTADKGTLFLDEIGDLPLYLQAKLLQLIEHGRYFPVGSDTHKETDVQVVCATNKTLADLRNPAMFRRDLFYRMAVIREIPPLRERPEDVEVLVRYWFDRAVEDAQHLGTAPELGMGRETWERLRSYHWPGNMREVRSVLQQAVFAAWGGCEVLPAHLPAWFQEETPAEDLTLAAMERRHIQEVVARTPGNITKAADLLGISRTTLYDKLRTYRPAASRPGEGEVDEHDMSRM